MPRQSGLAQNLIGRIELEPEFRIKEAVRGLEEFSHIWLLWEFSMAKREKWQPTVRPPRLGGNIRMGVFATRSPFRPNNIGMSAVKIEKIDMECEKSPIIYVSGIDMVDKTPIFDIKPYVPVSDCIPNASSGFSAGRTSHVLDVNFPDDLMRILPEEKRAGALEFLSLDPRPSYIDDKNRIFGAEYAGFNIKFVVDGIELAVFDVEKATSLNEF